MIRVMKIHTLIIAAALGGMAGAAPAQTTPAAAPVTTASGLVYQSLRDGRARRPRPPTPSRCTTAAPSRTASEFDSSYQRGQPAEFPLNRVIPCWTEGVQRMKVGGKARLTCPPAIAYGSRGAGKADPAECDAALRGRTARHARQPVILQPARQPRGPVT